MTARLEPDSESGRIWWRCGHCRRRLPLTLVLDFIWAPGSSVARWRCGSCGRGVEMTFPDSYACERIAQAVANAEDADVGVIPPLQGWTRRLL